MKKLVVIAMVLSLVSIASAEIWNGGTGSWGVPGNWNTPAQVPLASSAVTIAVDGSIVNMGAAAVAKQVSLGTTVAAGTATLNVSSMFTLADTAADGPNQAWLSPGRAASSRGVLNVYNDADIDTPRLQVAWGGGTLASQGSIGTFKMDGGLVTVGVGLWAGLTNTQFFVANGQNSVGYVYLNGGTLDLRNLLIANRGTGTNWSTDSTFRMAMNSTMSTATLDISGGAIMLSGQVTDLRNVIKTAYASGVTLTGYGIANNFAYSYDGTNTTVTGIIPEPATVALLGLGALVLIRRKRS